jgi:murein L,D-transpeptidase YcbB/YkuD
MIWGEGSEVGRAHSNGYRAATFLLAVFWCAAGACRAAALNSGTGGAQTLSPQGQAFLRSTIQTTHLAELRWPDFQKYRQDVATFYQFYGYALPWVSEMQPTPQARAVVALLQNADDKGLSEEDYDGPRWAACLEKLRPFDQQPTETDAVNFDLALTISLMRYISALHTGRIDPHEFGIEVDIAQRKYNLPQFIEDNVVHSPDVTASLSQVEPPYPGYKRTIQALHSYRLLAAMQDTGQPLPKVKKTVEPGKSYPGVPQLARFLHLVGDLPESVQIPEDDNVYQGPLVAAVKRFQDRHGLDPDGRLGRHTIAEMNVPLAQRVRQIELTLERWRWLPEQYGDAPIIVNIPEFRLRAYDKNFRVAVTMKVVVGKAYDHKTPIFMSNLQSVIFRPYWDVPISIVRAEIVPDLQRNPNYLDRQDMEIVDSRRRVLPDQKVTATVLDELVNGTLFVRQRPGPNNSLGLIKFDFPNGYSVYMHDTPARVLFSRSKRDFSHGCIRLENAVALADWVLRDNPGWDEERIRAAMEGADDQEVKLAHPIPVLIVYGTAIVRDDGLVRFYDDLYHQDAALAQALRTQYPYPH